MQTFLGSVLIAVCIIFAVAYMILSRGKKTLAGLATKAIASFAFAGLGILNYIASDRNLFSTFILCGLLFGAIADIVFGARYLTRKYHLFCFCAGVGLFAVGHVMYIMAFHTIAYISPFWYVVAIVLGFLVFYVPKTVLGAHYGRLWIIVLCYAIVICIMLICSVAVAIGNPFSYRGLLVCGALLFAISDYILLHILFIRPSVALNFANLSTYYLAQLIFAMSIVNTMLYTI